MEFTEREKEIILLIQKRTGIKIGTKHERTASFKNMERGQLKLTRHDITTALSRRNNPAFDNDEGWLRTRILKENLQIISDILDGVL